MMPPGPVAPIRDRLLSLLLLTALLHAILILGVTFSAGVGQKLSEGLEVLLVSDELPEADANVKADYLAQRSQRGAGNVRKGKTSTVEHAAVAAAAAIAGDPESDAPVLRTAAKQPTIIFVGIVPVRGTDGRATSEQKALQESTEGRGSGDELVLRGDASTGEWLAPNTRSYNLAPYLDSWRRKVERLGSVHYPNAVRRDGHAVAPVIEVALSSSGKLIEARVQRSSGDDALDQAALDILRLASPFSALPAALANDYRVLRFAYQWEFLARSVTAPTEAAPAP